MSLVREIELPPVWLALFMAAGWALSHLAPLFPFDGPAPLWAGRVVIGLGILLMVWSAWHFRRARTAIIPRREASALVTDGPYALSRNPIYLADAAILAGWGLAIGSVWPILLIPGFLWVITERFIRGEEAMLTARFPGAFPAWSARVRRWI